LKEGESERGGWERWAGRVIGMERVGFHLAVATSALVGIPVRPAKTRRDASPPPGVAGEMIAMEVTLSLEEIDSTGQRVCPRTTRTVARSTSGMLATVTRTLRVEG